MIKNPFITLILLIAVSCGTKKSPKTTGKPLAQTQPDYNYIIRLPGGWEMFDTVMDRQTYRILWSPEVSTENINGSIVIVPMDVQDIDWFTHDQKTILKRAQPGIAMPAGGKININGIDARWFTCATGTKETITYIIPSNGFAYVITCSTDAGRLTKYRPILDNIAQTFRVNFYASQTDTTGLSDTARLFTSDTTSRYMETGFYDVVDSHSGVRMQQDHTDEVYHLKPLPFVSVRNVVSARLLRHRYDNKFVSLLDLTFDDQGTTALKEIGLAVIHKKIAVVVANRLLYVIDEAAQIDKGETIIILEDYSQQEIESMLNAVLHKR